MQVLQLANDYIDRGLYRTLFTYLRKTGVESRAYVPVNYRRKGPFDVGPEVYVDPCFSDLDRFLFFSKQKKLLRGLTHWADLAHTDVIHAHTLFSAGYAARQLHRAYGIPYIVAVRNTDVNVFFKYMIHLHSTGVAILRDAYRVIFLSPAYRDAVISRYVSAADRQAVREKSLVIPNGINDYFLRNSPVPRQQPEAPLRLLYVGEINSNKNLELAVQVTELLCSRGMNAKLVAVGEIQEKKYRRLIEETPFLSYYPRCPQEEVLNHMRQEADIFILPSHNETFGLVYAEAMSQGLPVLYTRGQGFDGQFPEGAVGYPISDRDPSDAAEKVTRILAEYPKLSANCIAGATRFDWRSIAEEYKDIYQAAACKTVNCK